MFNIPRNRLRRKEKLLLHLQKYLPRERRDTFVVSGLSGVYFDDITEATKPSMAEKIIAFSPIPIISEYCAGKLTTNMELRNHIGDVSLGRIRRHQAAIRIATYSAYLVAAYEIYKLLF